MHPTRDTLPLKFLLGCGRAGDAWRYAAEDSSMERLETLKYAYNDQRSELDFRRRRENEIFTWSATILVVLIGSFLSSQVQKALFTTNSPLIVRVLATILIVGLTLFSVLWQQKTCRLRARNEQVLAHIAEEMGCFLPGSDGKSIYPEQWRLWGSRYLSLPEQLISASRICATTLLAITALVALWLIHPAA